MIEISPEHLARGAYVYVRQSTVDQLKHNHESRRRQYALADRARSLGWSEVVVIDDDLGVSAGGVARPGFQRLLAAICAGQVGAVVSIEASRLARNGRDWHTLLEFCALVGSLIIDEATLNHGAPGKCISFGSMRIDRDVAGEVLRVLQPLGIEAALHAIEERASDSDTKRRQIELALEQSRFEAARAHRQFDAVDPGNRLVAGELERRWNERLSTVAQYEAELQVMNAEREPEMTPELRQCLLGLGADLALAWDHPNASTETRKRILRAVMKEIVVRVTDTQLQLVVHWEGGDHTALAVVKNRIGQHRWTTDACVEQLINDLARQMPDGGIAALLNRMGQRTAKGHTWTESRVRSFRGDHRIAVYREGEREARGEMTLEQAAHSLQVSKMSVLRMIIARELPAHQACKGAAWVIRQDDIACVAARRAGQPDGKRPRTINPNQKTFEFQ